MDDFKLDGLSCVYLRIALSIERACGAFGNRADKIHDQWLL